MMIQKLLYYEGQYDKIIFRESLLCILNAGPLVREEVKSNDKQV